MPYFIGVAFGSMIAAFLSVRVVEYFFSGLMGNTANIVKPSVFVGVWTAVTASQGMRSFTGKVRGLRQFIGRKR
jgi:uncharacterized membrane protein